VRILHVVEAPPLLVGRELGGYEPALQNALEFQKQRAEALVAKTAELIRARGLKVTAVLEIGDPKSKILDVAEEWHADLIVLGSHGRKGLNRFLMGSVSDAVARHACCSVERSSGFVLQTQRTEDRHRLIQGPTESSFANGTSLG
jgi:nucleotide-binding universal stress UspA family protein